MVLEVFLDGVSMEFSMVYQVFLDENSKFFIGFS